MVLNTIAMQMIHNFIYFKPGEACFNLLNSDKTDILVIVPKSLREKFMQFYLKLDGSSVSAKAVVKNLGID